MDLGLKDKVAVVTGTGSQIGYGKAIALALAREGCHVIGVDLDGTGDYVTLPAGVVDIDDMTIAAWVYWDSGDRWQRIFDFGTGTSQYMFLSPRSGGRCPYP